MARYFGLIPAGGVGARLGGDVPKQYRQLVDRPMLAWSIDALLAEPRIEHVWVVVHESHRTFWSQLERARVTFIAVGGQTRADSVFAGASALRRSGSVRESDWVLVHDAARPCLSRADVTRLIDQLFDDSAGGLLAQPLTDTLKRAVDSEAAAARVDNTVPRDGLWRAATPQMFRLDTLLDALADAATRLHATDEAAAVEALMRPKGPRLVACSAANLKVTSADDWLLAEAVLNARVQAPES